MITTISAFIKDTKPTSKVTLVPDTLKMLNNVKMVFISHKHGENDYEYRFVYLLTTNGFTGYVDWQDDQMLLKTSGIKANKIKEKITKAYKFILIATDAAVVSKWCNWELGFGDAHKFEDHIAVLPIKKDNTDYNGNEYLSIYPTIQLRGNYEYLKDDYCINYLGGREISLREWLNL